MNFIYEPALLEYMKKMNKNTIVVEVITSNNSDFEVTELHVHLISQKQADFFKNKKHFIGKETAAGEVLLPPYRLEYDETITFSLKSFLIFHWIRYDGIRL